MAIRNLKLLVGAGLLILGLGWATQDHAVAGSGGAAMVRTVVGTAACDDRSSGRSSPSRQSAGFVLAVQVSHVVDEGAVVLHPGCAFRQLLAWD